MSRTPLRRLVVAGAAALVLAGCSTTSTETEPAGGSSADPAAADAFPVTIEHAFGETTIESEPTRVATIGWVDQDHALALGVVPVGAIEINWGGNEQMSTPWFDDRLEELGGEQPTRYSDLDGTPIDEIAALQPDLILATNSGLTQQDYNRLTRLDIPVVAYPDQPWLTPWRTSLELVGQALGRSDQAEEILAETEAAMEQAAEDNADIVGKSFIFASLSAADTSKIDYYTPEDNRPLILTELGMVNAPIIEEISKPGEFYGTLSAERAPDLEADVFITYAESEDDLASFRDDPLLGQIPGIRSGNVLASTDQTDALGMSSPSPLSIPYAMENFIPQVAAALRGE